MLENLRRKSLVKTYHDPIYPVRFEQGHAIYLDSCSIAEHKQKLSTKKVDKPFPHTFESVSKEFRLIPNALKDVQFNMIYCKIGTFMMGYKDQGYDQTTKEKIDRPFLLGETEITQELYKKVIGYNPSGFKYSQNPVEKVSWVDAILFCNKLSKLQGLDECYTKNPKSLDYGWDCDFNKNGYRLPKEKEWEYAAKAGTENKYAGTNSDNRYIGEYAWFYGNSAIDGEKQSHPVKTKKPNEWGFYDMSGNVWEWCWDKKYPNDLNPSAQRVNRGGSWGSKVLHLRSDYSTSDSPDHRGLDLGFLGFRVCRSIVN